MGGGNRMESSLVLLEGLFKIALDQRGRGGRRFCYISLLIFEGEGVFYEIDT